MSVLGEQKADGYLRGQIWNRDEEQEVNPYIFVRANQNWAEPGESVLFEVRRRFKSGDRGRRRKGLLGVGSTIVGGASGSIVVPAGAGGTSLNITAGNSNLLVEILNGSRYKLSSSYYSSVPVYNLQPYTVTTYKHTFYVWTDIFREKWVYVGGWQRLPSIAGYDPPSVYGSVPIGPLPRRDRYTAFLNWGFFDVWVERVYTPVYSIITSSPTPPGYQPGAITAATIHPSIDLSIYRLCTGYTILLGQPCPIYVPNYQFSTSPIPAPGGTTPSQMLYQADPIVGGNPPNAPAAWVYRIEGSGNFAPNPAQQIDTVVTPPPPTQPKFKDPWAEDPAYTF